MHVHLFYNLKWEREMGMGKYTLHIYTNTIVKIAYEATDLSF